MDLVKSYNDLYLACKSYNNALTEEGKVSRLFSDLAAFLDGHREEIEEYQLQDAISGLFHKNVYDRESVQDLIEAKRDQEERERQERIRLEREREAEERARLEREAEERRRRQELIKKIIKWVVIVVGGAVAAYFLVVYVLIPVFKFLLKILPFLLIVGAVIGFLVYRARNK